MSTMNRSTETSVTFSLAELAQIEAERVREEDVHRARAREMEARARREAEERRRAEEAARAATEAEARARREREAAAERARIEAREQAAITVARIEAEAKARLEADNAARAHELEVLRVRTESGHRRLQRALAAALGLVLCGGAAAGYSVSRHVAGLTQETAELREGQQALARERDRAKETELAALDRRYAALRARPLVRDAEQARATAEAARSAIDARSLDHDRLRALSDALDGLQARIEGLEKLAALDQRHADLTAWAGERRRSEITAAARLAAARAKAMGDESSLRAYEGALDQLRDALARSTAGQGRTTTDPGPSGPACSDPHDPMCGFNGRAL
jgi:colicin import membrane protein